LLTIEVKLLLWRVLLILLLVWRLWILLLRGSLLILLLRRSLLVLLLKRRCLLLRGLLWWDLLLLRSSLLLSLCRSIKGERSAALSRFTGLSCHDVEFEQVLGLVISSRRCSSVGGDRGYWRLRLSFFSRFH